MSKLAQLRQDLLPKEQGTAEGYTLVSEEGLENIEELLKKIKKEKIGGNFVETGAWKGGACIYARSVMNELGLTGTVYACDSFEGLPKPDDKYPVDAGDEHWKIKDLNIKVADAENNFIKFGCRDGVEIVKGFFEETMPVLKNKVGEIAILRLDGDMYGSTMVVLENLYDNVVDGGYIIVDDYALHGCKKAVDNFIKSRGITPEIKSVDHCIIYWKKHV